MLNVKKSGKTEYGYWALGVLKYEEFEISDIFSVDKELLPNENYEVSKLKLRRLKNGDLKFSLKIK